MPTVIIDGRTVEARAGQTVLEVARAAGITVPTLCYHPDLSVVGSCRLCLVEVEGLRAPVPACATPAGDGMVIRTETPALARSRRFVLELLLRHYSDAGYAAADRDETEFLHWVQHSGAQPPEEVDRPAPRYAVDSDPNPFVWVDLNKCILCTRCVRACAEVQGRFVWGLSDRGGNTQVVAGLSTPLLDARCESCGACVAYCPTGALDDKMSVGLGKPDRVVPTTCAYCGVGCGLNLNVQAGRIIRVTSRPEAPVNGMSLCVKGRYGYDYVHHPDRLTRPRVRSYLLAGSAKSLSGPAGEWVETDWDTALAIAAAQLARAKRESGPDTVGVLGSAKCTNEENYLMQKFARQVIGTHNIDHCARLCHSSTVAGLAMAFGSGAMSNSMDDVAADAAAVFLIGSNVTEQHPVFGAMLRQAVLRRGLKLVVADPRRIDITEFAVLHLRQRPGTDVALLNGLAYVILQRGWHDQDFIARRCEGFEEFKTTVEQYPPERVAAITGVAAADLCRAAEVLAHHKPLAAIWAMGITQHTTGVLNVLSLANLQMLLGNLGARGGGVNPLRGQNNVQGACDMGALPNVFPGYQAVTDPAITARFDAAWALQPGNSRPEGTPALGLTDRPGLTVTEMVEAYGARRLRALYVLGEDLAMTEPDVNHARGCLAGGEFLLLQEIFPSETSAFADVLLPGASFAEKRGTFTNTERRVQLVRQAIDPPGDARQDWAITAALARRVLAIEGRTPAGPQAGWGYGHPAQILDEVAAVTPSYAGINNARLERGDRLQWPVPDVSDPGTPILHVGRFARGKGKFHAVDHLPAAELPDGDYPLLLTTGRVLYHWHGGELSRRARGLLEVYPEALVEVSPEDAARVGLNDRTTVRVRSRRGEMVARAVITARVAAGVVFGNFHFPGRHNVNNLTIGATDPVAKIPEYKVCAVALEAITDPEHVPPGAGLQP
jgi:formate dehydrogenase alpha subunit